MASKNEPLLTPSRGKLRLASITCRELEALTIEAAEKNRA